MGDFSVPGLQIHKVISGATQRYRQLQEEDWQKEQARRDQYIAHLGRMMETAWDDETVDQLNAEMTRAMNEPPDKVFEPRPIKPPSQFQSEQARQKKADATATAARRGATPQGFDFKQAIQLMMSGADGAGGAGGPGAAAGPDQSSPMPADVPQSAGGPPDSIGALPAGITPPSMIGGPTASAQPPTIPPFGAGSLSAASGSPTPPAVITPPGKSVPAPSPLVGTLPGTPSPTPGAASAGLVPPPMPTAPDAAPERPRGMFMGAESRARLPYELNAEYGMSKAGRPLGSKPVMNVRDLVYAAEHGWDIAQVPPTPDAPLGFVVTPRDTADLSPIQQANLDKTKAQTRLFGARVIDADIGDSRIEQAANTKAEIGKLRLALTSAKDAKSASTAQLRITNAVATGYRAATQSLDESQSSYDQLAALLTADTGPADYMAILSAVHGIDNTAAREGEVKLFRNAASWDTRLAQAYLRLTTGQLLDDGSRQAILNAATTMNTAVQAKRALIDEQYATMAFEGDLNPISVGLGRGTGAKAKPRAGVGGSSDVAATPTSTTSTPVASLTNLQINPTTKQQIGWDAASKRWIDVATGKPVQ